MSRYSHSLVRFFVLTLLCVISDASIACDKHSLSPISFGLLNANTGEERFYVLLKTHKVAVEQGLSVDYRGLGCIDITIPQDATSIPLGQVNDFSDVVFNVTNDSKDFYLFSYSNKSHSIDITGNSIDKGDFSKNPQLCSGKKLLSIEDNNPWVANRKSRSYGHQRKDILLLDRGKAKNETVMPYNNAQSDPVCKYYSIVCPFIQISGIILNRVSGSTAKTYLCRIIGTDDVRMKKIIINTPHDDLIRDAAISIIDCTNVYFEDVRINGTYSRTDYFGYGISMNNVWNFHATKLCASGNWGIFGNNNINTAKIENSEINRFDIHCYGRDISFNKVTFVNLYNQFSSTFGTIKFDKCVFRHFAPVLYETSYNAYTPHEVVFNRCVFQLDAERNYLIAAGRLDTEINSREELKEKCWPNITITKMKVIVDEAAESFFVFNVALDPKYDGYVHSMDKIVIDGLSFEYGDYATAIPISLVNKDVKTDKPLEITVKRLVTRPEAEFNLRMNRGTENNRVSIRRSSIRYLNNE